MNIHYTSQFKRDYKRIKKQSKAIEKLKTVIGILVSGI
ncbi:MAG: type II toxin-antitoxin system YafQ family toxin [Candidatus Anammoxibacter sp.]